MVYQLNCMPEGFMIPSKTYYVRLQNNSGSNLDEPWWRFSIGL